MKILKNVIIFFGVNLLLFVLLYLKWIYPFKKEIGYIRKRIIVSSYYSEKINIKDIKNPFFKMVNGVDLTKDNYVVFDEIAFLSIARNDRHKRNVGDISIYGEYKSEINLQNFLEELGVLDVEKALEDKEPLIIYNDTNDSCLLFFKSSNKIEISFRSKFPYKLISEDEIYNDFQNYFINKSNKYSLNVLNTLKLKYKKIFISLIVFNILLIICSNIISKYKNRK